jgi:hypothetical protein
MTDRKEVVEKQDARIRAIALRYVRAECVTDDLLAELAQAILDADIGDGEGYDPDVWIGRWFTERVAREPAIGRWGLN